MPDSDKITTEGSSDEYSRLRECHEMYVDMEAGNHEAIKAAKESALFYTGGYGTGHWTDEDLKKLKEEDRPPIQLNIGQAKVNLVVGLERQNRTSLKAYPIESSDKDFSKLITALLFHQNQNGSMDKAFSRSHKDGTIGGRGWIEIYVQPGEYYAGEIFVVKAPWADMLIDVEALDDDIDNWSRLIRTRWIPLDRLKASYPEQLSDVKIKNMAERMLMTYTGLDFSGREEADALHEHGSTYSTADWISPSEFLDDEKKRVRLVEYWEREWTRIWYLFDRNSGKIQPREFKSSKEARNLLDEVSSEVVRNGFGIIAKNVPKTYYTRFSGARLLEDHVRNPYKHNNFPYVPYFYYFEDVGERIETYGLMENMKDPQREKNKRRSLGLDIFARGPKGGGVFADGSVTAEELRKASITGNWIGLKGLKGRSIRDVLQSWDFSYANLISVVASLEERAEIDAKEISGATDPLMGVASGSKESGFAAQTRIRQGMMTLQEQMDNHDQMKVKVARLVISNMQQYWTEEKIRRIIGERVEEGDLKPETIERFLGNFEAMKFDVKIDQAAQSPTMRAMKAAQIGDLIKMGYASLLSLWLKYADIDAGDEIIEKIEQDRVALLMMQQLKQGKGGQPGGGATVPKGER